MWGSCFWFCIPSASSRSSRSRRLLSRHNLVTHNLVTHNLLTHTTCTHTQLSHTQLAHTHNLHTHTTYSHTTCTHTHTTYSHTQLAHTHTTYSHTTCLHTTCPHTTCTHTHTTCSQTTYSHTTYAHTTCLHTTCPHTQLAHTHTTCSHTQLTHTQLPHIQLAHIQLAHIQLSTHGSSLCVAGVALMALGWLWRCAWSAMALWRRGVLRGRRVHFETSAFTLCGRRGTWRHRLLLCVAGVALMALGWLWRRAWSAMALWRRGVLRGRRGTSRHLPSLCVAGVALVNTWIVTLRGRCGTYGMGWLWWRAWFPGRAGTPRRFAWQAWHFVTSTFTLCGRRGTWWHGSSLCVAGVALMALGWQLTHTQLPHIQLAHIQLAHTWIVTLRGRRGTA